MAESSVSQKIDTHQLKVLIKNNLRLDWRGATNPLSSYNKKKSKIPGLLMIIGMNIFVSLFISIIIPKSENLLTILTLCSTLAMSIISIQIMLEFGNTLISPDDYNVISPHPVNSKTFFVAKIIHMVIYVSILTTSIFLVPSIFTAIKYHSPFVIPIVWIHFWVSNLFSAVLVANIYTWILKKVDRRRLERWLGYVHMFFILGIYLGMNTLPHWVRSLQGKIDINHFGWAKLLPAYWFATWIDIIHSGWNQSKAILGVLGLIVLYILGKTAISYLSLSYAESLVKTGWNKVGKRQKKRDFFLLRFWHGISNDEEKALMLLVRANFKHDIHFRLAIMALIPIIVFYIVISLVVDGPKARDPFLVTGDSQVMTNFMLGIACIMAPYSLVGALQASKQWRSAWVFYATPIDRVKLILAMEKIANILVTIPLAIILAVALAYIFGSILHALLHTIALLSVSLCTLTLLGVFAIHLPFAMDTSAGNWARSLIKPMLLAALIFGIPLAIVGIVGYGGYLGWGGFVLGFILLRWLISRGQRRRIKKAMLKWEFTG